MVGIAVESINMNPFLLRVFFDVVDNRRANLSCEIFFSVLCSPHSVNPNSNVRHDASLSWLKPGYLFVVRGLQPEGWSYYIARVFNKHFSDFER
jgi:hypothetical protein